jgi:hypothetical protein
LKDEQEDVDDGGEETSLGKLKQRVKSKGAVTINSRYLFLIFIFYSVFLSLPLA